MYNQSRIYIYLDLILNDPLLATKFFVPPLQTNLVHRQRLLDRLDESIRNGKRLTLISTPAGYGKTTLLGEWVQRSNYPTAWLSLDEGDNDPVKFMTYLIYALREIKPDLQCPAHLTGSLGRIAGPLWAGFVFDLNPILPFISGAVVILIGFIVSLVWLRGDVPAAPIQKGVDQTTIS